MIILRQSNTDKLQLVTSSAATLDVKVSFADLASGTPPSALNPDRQLTAITSATTTDILATPGSGNIRNAKSIHIMNKDASLSSTVTVLYATGGGPTQYQLWKTTLRAGESLEYIEGIGWFLLADANAQGLIIKVLNADDAGGQAVSTAQPWFPTAGGVTLPAATTYRMKGLLAITHGATTHTTGVSFGGTATFTSINFFARPFRSAADSLSAVFSGIHVSSAANAVTDVTGTQAATYLDVDGIVRINAAGTFIPQFQFSANPTGTITIKKDSFFELRALGDNTLVSLGTWA